MEGREIGANTKKPPVFSEGVGDTYGCTRKGMGGRGGGIRKEWENIIALKKSNIIDQQNPISLRGLPSLSGTTPAHHYQVLTAAQVVGQLSSARAVRQSQGRPAKHRPGATGEGSLLI